MNNKYIDNKLLEFRERFVITNPRKLKSEQLVSSPDEVVNKVVNSEQEECCCFCHNQSCAKHKECTHCQKSEDVNKGEDFVSIEKKMDTNSKGKV